MCRQAAGRQGRGLFWSVKGGQEENWSSGDEDPPECRRQKRGGWGCGDIEEDPTILDLIGMHPGLDMTAPLMQSVRMEGHYAAGSDTSVTIVGKLRRERALAVRPTLEGGVRRLTLGSEGGVGTADSSRALDVVGCYGIRYRARGKGAEFASKVLSVLSTCPLHTNSGCGKERRILIGPW